MIKRRKTRTVTVGNIKIGSRFPVSIQSMTNTYTRQTEKTIAQIRALTNAGCEIVRLAVKNIEDARAIRKIKRKVNVPLVADIHFDYLLSLEAIKSGIDKIRINPGNISKPEELKTIIKAAKDKKIPIRIGLNSGSLPKSKKNKPQSNILLEVALKYIKLFERENFRDIIISLKSSSVYETVNAYRKLAVLCNYPFHLGLTAAGTHDSGIVKSSISIGSLLLDGIGDTIRVSLTGDPKEEVLAAKRILGAVGLRRFAPDVISCPTCGRCGVNLVKIVNDFQKALDAKCKKEDVHPLTVAIMGCEVNGPGEAKEADIGIAFGKNRGVLFKKGKIIKKVSLKTAVKELIKNL